MSPGDRFGSLTVQREITQYKFVGTLWRCRCDCGRRVRVWESHLIDGTYRDCGSCPTMPWEPRQSRHSNGTTPKRVVSRARPHQKPPIY